MKHLKTYEANFISRLFGGSKDDDVSSKIKGEYKNPDKDSEESEKKLDLDDLKNNIKSIKSDKFEIEFGATNTIDHKFGKQYNLSLNIKYNPSIVNTLKSKIKSDVFTINDIVGLIKISVTKDDIVIRNEVKFKFNRTKSFKNIKITDYAINLSGPINRGLINVSVADGVNPNLRVIYYKEDFQENFGKLGILVLIDTILDKIKDMCDIEKITNFSEKFINRYFKYYDDMIEYDEKFGDFIEKEEDIESILYDLKDISSDFRKSIHDGSIEYIFKIDDLGFKPQKKSESVSIPYGKSYGGSKSVDFTFSNAGFKLTKNLIQVFRCLDELNGGINDIMECNIDIDITENYLTVFIINDKFKQPVSISKRNRYDIY
jgi:hypothetical protein